MGGQSFRRVAGKLPLIPVAAVNMTRSSIWRYRLRRIHAAHRQAHPDDYAPFEEGIREYARHGGLVHDNYAYSLVALWKLLESHRPATVLELGSGGSTTVFARYCATYGAQVVTLDEDEHWLGVTKAIVTSLHPEANVEFPLAPRVREWTPFSLGREHERLRRC